MWSLSRGRHPDMNVNDLDYSIIYPIYQNFDIDRSWELLAASIGYSTNQIQTFELEYQRPHGSPTRTLLRDWGSRGATIRDLYDKLGLINKTQSMRLLEPIVHPNKGRKERPADDKPECSSCCSGSMETKSDNFLTFSCGETSSYNPESLPVPSLKKKNNENINLNTVKQEKPCDDKFVKNLFTASGAASIGAIEVIDVHADGPASTRGNLGAASSGRGSFDRVRSVVEGSMEYMQGLSQGEREMARAMMSTPNYTFKELNQATNGFSVNHKLGQGKFGVVYQGTVKNTKCAIKKLIPKRSDTAEDGISLHMSAELKALSRYRHDNLVCLYGYAIDGDEVCLVYQYMSRGSLYDCLHSKTGCKLSWEQRLSILQGAACGLQFLHTVEKKPVIHGDIKSANILLTQHYEAKIGDLGLAQQATGGEVTGKLTHITKKNTCIQDYENRAYYAPEIVRGNGFSVKGDTFAFGVVMLETLTGKVAYDERREGSVEEKYLVGFIESQIDECPKVNKQTTFQDPALKVGFPVTIYSQVFDLALSCVQDRKKDRPEMVEVYKELEKCEDSENYENAKVTVQAERPVSLFNKNEKPGTKNDLSTGCLQTASFSSAGSYSPDLKSPQQPGSSSTEHSQQDPRLQSPIDMLPPGQPLPVPFKLAVEQDIRQQQHQKQQRPDGNTDPQYTNVAQLTQKMQECSVTNGDYSLASDPKKLSEIQKFDNNFHSSGFKSGAANSGCTSSVSCPEKTAKSLSEKIAAKQQEAELDRVSFTSETSEKFDVVGDKGSFGTSKNDAHVYVNTQKPCLKEVEECSFDDQEEYGRDATENSEPSNSIEYQGEGAEQSDADPVYVNMIEGFHKELDEIKHKADKYNKIFQCGQEYMDSDYELWNAAVDDDYGFDFDEEGPEDDSETSTITESVNNDFDQFNSSDITDEVLFAQDSDPSYVNITEKICNNSIEAQLERHQYQLHHYQEMVTEDCDELQSRAVHTQKQAAKAQGHSSLQNGQTASVTMEKQDMVSSQHVSDKSGNLYSMPPVKVEHDPKVNLQGQCQNGPVQAPVKGQGEMNANCDSVTPYQQQSPKVACEIDCLEYI